MEKLTAYIAPINGGFIGIVLEVPGAMSYGRDLHELRDRLADAVNVLRHYRRIESRTFLDTMPMFKSPIIEQLACV